MTPPAASAELTPRRRVSLPLLLAAVVLPLYALDQGTKYLVATRFDLYDSRVVVPGFFSLVYWINKGAAFGIFENRYAFFLTLSAVALVVLAVLYRQGVFNDPLPRAGFALLIPGILGNLTDRLAHGHVIDFLLFDLHVPGAHPWPAFNVADSCICVAVGLFLLGSFRDYQKEGRRQQAEGRRRTEAHDGLHGDNAGGSEAE